MEIASFLGLIAQQGPLAGVVILFIWLFLRGHIITAAQYRADIQRWENEVNRAWAAFWQMQSTLGILTESQKELAKQSKTTAKVVSSLPTQEDLNNATDQTEENDG